MILVLELAYIAFCIWLADENSQRIKQDKKIRHALQGAIHFFAGIALSFLFNWFMLPLILFSVRVWFNTLLNLFRGLSPFYVTPKPSAIQDKIEQAIFKKNGVIPFVMAFMFWILFNFYATNSK